MSVDKVIFLSSEGRVRNLFNAKDQIRDCSMDSLMTLARKMQLGFAVVASLYVDDFCG